MGALCTRHFVIPDREIMIEIVDCICGLEEKLKKGEQLTKQQESAKRKLDRVARDMKSLQKFRS